MDAREIVGAIRAQNWKNGGVPTMDVDEAEAMVQKAIDAERERCAEIAERLDDCGGKFIANAIRDQL